MRKRFGFHLAGATHADRTQIGKRRAFSLAEVLITLTIIGVVASMTIPTLMQNYQKKQYSTGAEKFYSQFNQVLQQMAVDGGTIGNISQYFGTNSTATVGATIASYYKVVKECGTTAGDECFAVFDDNYDGSANTTSDWTNGASPNYKFVTADGMSFAIASYNNSCTQNRGFAAAPDSPTYNSTCGTVYIDVNGKNKPNNFGRDVFKFYITSNKTPILYPVGGFYVSGSDTGTLTGGGGGYWNYNGTTDRCRPNTSTSSLKYGFYCAGRLMDKGWEMDW